MKLIKRSSRSFTRRTVDYAVPTLQTARRAPRRHLFDRRRGASPTDFSPRAGDARK